MRRTKRRQMFTSTSSVMIALARATTGGAGAIRSHPRYRVGPVPRHSPADRGPCRPRAVPGPLRRPRLRQPLALLRATSEAWSFPFRAHPRQGLRLHHTHEASPPAYSFVTTAARHKPDVTKMREVAVIGTVGRRVGGRASPE